LGVEPADRGGHQAVVEPLVRDGAPVPHAGTVAIEVDGLQPPGPEFGMLAGDQPVGAPGRVDALVIDDHLEVQFRGQVAGVRDVFEPAVGQVTRLPRQAEAGMEDKAAPAVRREIPDLAGEFVAVEVVIPEPERHHSIVGPWRAESLAKIGDGHDGIPRGRYQPGLVAATRAPDPP